VNQQDKQFITLFSIVIAALAVFTVAMFILARYFMLANQVDYGPLVAEEIDNRVKLVAEASAGETKKTASASTIDNRIKPIGEASTGKTKKTASASTSAQSSGQQVYSQVCSSCHTSGMMGAPRISDKSAWKSRLAQGKQTLYQHAINGIGAMPPKGGSNLPDSQIKVAVDYIVAQVSGGGGGQQQAKASQGGGKQQQTQASSKGAQSSGQQAITAKSTAQGESVYTSMCSACHNSGALGAPRISDKSAWKSRLAQGQQTLYQHAINGIGAMPAKGGHPQLGDEKVKAAVDHIIATVSGGGG
jgi:cytochrome c5